MKNFTILAALTALASPVFAEGDVAEGEVQFKTKVVALNHIDVWGWRGMAFAKRNLPGTV